MNEKKTQVTKWLVGLIFALGILFQVRQYIFNRSLWMDEIHLAEAIQKASFRDFLRPMLDYRSAPQPAPPGFLAAVKSMTLLFGTGDYLLRLYPLFWGLLSLFLFYKTAPLFIEKKAIPLAVAFFVFSDRLIYFSTELRPYISDAGIFLLVLFWASRRLGHSFSDKETIASAVFGFSVLLFSNPAVFFLAGAWSVFLAEALKRRDRIQVLRIFLVGICWAAFFLEYYLRVLSEPAGIFPHQLLDESYYMPFPPGHFKDLGWFLAKFVELFQNPADFSPPWLASAFFAAGCFFLFRRSRRYFFLVFLPLLFAMGASGLRKYIFADRFILFSLPALSMVTAQGVSAWKPKNPWFLKIGRLLAAVILLVYPVKKCAHHLFYPRTGEEMREVLEKLKKDWKTGDILYLAHSAHPGFQYYAPRTGLDVEYIMGQDVYDRSSYFMFEAVDVQKVRKESAGLKGHKRIWFLFSHMHPGEKEIYLAELDEKGRRDLSIEAPGTAAYLYDLTEE